MRSALGQSQSAALPALLSQLLGQTNLGSVGGLLAQLQQGGLSNQVSSWLSNGANQAISPDQLRSALGSEQLQQMTQASGLPLDQLLAVLSQHLPQAVDRMSPNGALDESAADAAQDSQDEAPGGSLADQAGLGDVGR
jgi:uncharacterized protein YidB (DUF937 family)